MALPRVRGLPASCTTPSRTSIIGLIDSSEPMRAWAPPTRPPFLRLSSVSRQPNRRVRGTMAVTIAVMSSSVRPSPAAAAAAATWLPRPPVTVSESTIRMGASGIERCAFCADWIVAESPPERLMHSTPSPPRRGRCGTPARTPQAPALTSPAAPLSWPSCRRTPGARG